MLVQDYFNTVTQLSKMRAELIISLRRRMISEGRWDSSRNTWDQAVEEFERLVQLGELTDPMDMMTQSEFVGGEA